MAKQEQEHHLYEGMYILSASLSDDARQKALDKVTTGITKRGGEIRKTFDQGRKKLAYEIDKKRDGYYIILYFTAPADAIKDMWREYHLNEDLIRFMTLRVESVPEKIEFQPLPV
ncbi:MAG: 30S ribosomal protein S6 [Verrucomicrobia bacterium]|nr:30S ribosomal protein S6 [Verrucomicrobiota bacterium]